VARKIERENGNEGKGKEKRRKGTEGMGKYPEINFW